MRTQHSPLPLVVTGAAFTLLLVLSPLGSRPLGTAKAAISTAGGSSTVAWTDPYTIVQHKIPGNNTNPWGIAAAPDGTVWFVEQGTNQLGSYDPSLSKFTQYAIPTPGSTPSSVAVDSSENVWFSELTANRLGELQSGAAMITEYPIPPAEVSLVGTSQSVDCGPGAVLPDPRGFVWVACLFSNQIDEFFPSNATFARFDLPVFNSAPAGLLLDGKGNLWFTAADAQMLGKAEISALRNGTTDGISEIAPVNDTYTYSFSHATSFGGGTTTVVSSLPTPSGIAMDGSGRLWVTEHVDTSFDSYDPATSSLVKYWTSQTNNAYGYDVSFPNGIAVDGSGEVWIGEHYGNKIAAFNPTGGLMEEYPVPCCRSTIAGVYSVALDRNGTLWFVEINGNAIGEVVKTTSTYSLSLSLPETSAALAQGTSLDLPLNFTSAAMGQSPALDLAVSGISGTGAPDNLSASFSQGNVSLSASGRGSSQLNLKPEGLRPGVYYLTLSAYASPRDVYYSVILKLTVTGGVQLPLDYLVPAVVVLTAASLFTAWMFTRRRKPRRARRRASY